MILPLILLFAVFVVTITIVLLRRGARGPGHQADGPACGACGYATRGITELTCPECGADLRKVGIVKPGEGRSILAGCLLPTLLTILVFLLAIGGFTLSFMIVPSYEDQSTHFDVWPESDAYAGVLLRTEKTLIIPASDRHNAHSFNIQSTQSPPYTTTIDYGGGKNATVKVDSIALEVMSMPMRQSSNTITYAPPFRVDPKTRVATWTDAQGNTKTNGRVVTDKDLLAYFADYNIDTNRPDVVAEAQELVNMIDGLIAGNSQFTLRGFQDGGYGSGSSGTLGPPWFIDVYCLAWFVIWVIVLIVVRRMSRKHAAKASA